MMNKKSWIRLVIALSIATCLFQPRPARAYRPFDSTDADTAQPGTLELELGLAEFRHDETFSLATPHIIANVGLASGLELVLEGSQMISLSRRAPGPTASSPEASHLHLERPEVSLKMLLLPGSLQEAGPWPSVALEAGIFLSLAGQNSGAQGTIIASERLPWFTLHANASFMTTRRRTNRVDLGLVVEGPHYWPIRPVGEVTTSHGGSAAWPIRMLAGAIWRVRSTLSLDIAGVIDSDSLAYEIRLGLTWAIHIPGRQKTRQSMAK